MTPQEYLMQLDQGKMKLGLERMQQLIAVLRHPQASYPCIHVAGSNGKGSTCAYLASILNAQGYQVGVYTSPHLYSIHERITQNGVSITDAALNETITHIREQTTRHTIPVTFFEFLTACALHYFAQRKVDVAIIEVGLGGRLDATNVITPVLSLVTNISKEHTDILGHSIQKIAYEKAGIIKQNIPVLIGNTYPDAIQEIRVIANERHAPVYLTKEMCTARPTFQSLEKQTFQTTGIIQDSFDTQQLGSYQLDNACTALCACSLLNTDLAKHNLSVSLKAMKEGILTSFWPGRLHIVSKRPLVIVDGSHNAEGVHKTLPFVQDLKKRKTLVLGISQGKDAEAMIEQLVPLFDHVVCTQAAFKPMACRQLANKVLQYNKNVTVEPQLLAALLRAKKLTQNDETVFLTGSLYLAGDALRTIREHSIF